MASFNIELNNKPDKGSKEHSLMLRITINRKHARMNLLYSVKPINFNPNVKNTNFIRINHPNHKKINQYLEGKLFEAKEALKQLEKERKYISASAIRDLLQNPASKCFSDYMWNYMEAFKKKQLLANYKNFRTCYNGLISYTGKKKIMFHEIDIKFLNNFEAHLLKEGKAQNSVAGYLKKIRVIFNKAVADETIKMSENPFLTYKIKHGKVHKDRLDLNNIAKIAELDLPRDKKIWHARNAFIFAFYAAGMRVSDLLMLKWKNIENGRISYIMIKTKKQHSFTLPKQAVAILDKYKDRDPESFVFPFMTDKVNLDDPAILFDQIGSKTALINKYLKEIAKIAEIDARITTHIARHSFADIARTKVENLYNLSKTLGHSSLNVTENYLSAFDEKVIDSTLDEVFNT